LLKLSDRLQRMADYIEAGAVVADIGTDHAYLPTYLVQQEICQRAIASELNPGPLEAARNTVSFYRLGDRVDVREGNGLQVLRPGEADLLVIAGMGGLKIRDILSESPSVLKMVKRLILQPLGGDGHLRRWLLAHGWGLADEDIVLEDGRYYVITIAEPSPSEQCGITATPDNEVLEIGPCLIEKRHPLLIPYLEMRMHEMEVVIKSLDRARTPAARHMQKTWCQKLDSYRKVIECRYSAGR
jgi:tRNA (adenine22-N1)-methyltransferase